MNGCLKFTPHESTWKLKKVHLRSLMAESTFSPFVAACFTVNYIMGTGFLTLPWAFNNAGIGLSLLALCLVGFISDVSKNYVLETMGRAEVLTSTNRKGKREDELDRLVNGQKSQDPSSILSATVVGPRKFEVIDLCTMFLPPIGATLYMCALGLYMYGTLWAYTR